MQRMLSSSLTRLTLSTSFVPRLTPVLVSAASPSLHPNLLPTITSVCALHTSDVVERARQSTRIRKKKINDANKKKKEERLRKNPPPIPKKVILGPFQPFFTQYWFPGATDADFQRAGQGAKALEET